MKLQTICFFSIILFFAACKKEDTTPTNSGVSNVPPMLTINSREQFYLKWNGQPYSKIVGYNGYLNFPLIIDHDTASFTEYEIISMIANGTMNQPNFIVAGNLLKPSGQWITIDDLRQHFAPGTYSVLGNDSYHDIGLAFAIDTDHQMATYFGSGYQAGSEFIITDTLSGYDSLRMIDYLKIKANFHCTMSTIAGDSGMVTEGVVVCNIFVH